MVFFYLRMYGCLDGWTWGGWGHIRSGCFLVGLFETQIQPTEHPKAQSHFREATAFFSSALFE